MNRRYTRNCRATCKREKIARATADLDRQIRKHRAEIAQIDGMIQRFAPGVVAAKRRISKGARSAHFVTGELTRRCQTALREANGRFVTADEVAASAMREKGLDVGDGALRQDITRRILWTLNRQPGKGGFTKEEWSADARWELAVL
jgi:hypothetical protein